MDKKQVLLGSAATLAYFADLQHNKLDEYETNEDQYKRFINVIKYCLTLEMQYDCELFRCIFNPRWIDGSVEMIFHGDWAVNSDVFQEFVNAVGSCDAINVATNPLGDDWVQVTFFVRNLWKHKDN